MKFFIKEGDANKPLLVTELSSTQLWQASAISDGIARLIPHEGVDYDIEMHGASFNIFPLTEKGYAWKEYVDRAKQLSPPDIISSKTDVSMYLYRLIPEEGIDYDPRIIYKAPGSRNLSMDIEATTERGRFWKSYVLKMIKKYPPTTTYESERLPEEAAEVDEVPDGFEEGDKNEKVVH